MWAFSAASRYPLSRGVIGPIPPGEWALQTNQGRSAGGRAPRGGGGGGGFRLKNRKGEPSRAVLITFEGCTLPTEVRIACTPHRGVGLCGRRAALHRVSGHRPHQVAVPLAGDPLLAVRRWGPTRWRGAATPLAASTATVAIARPSGGAPRCWSTPGPTFSGAAATSRSLSRCSERCWSCSAAGFTRADRTAKH